MTHDTRFWMAILTAVVALQTDADVSWANAPPGWFPLFDGKTLAGWQAAEHADSWRVRDGRLIARGGRSHLFYCGSVGGHDFRNFELEAEVRTQNMADTGIFFHTCYRQTGFPDAGYEVQIKNACREAASDDGLTRTGGLHGIRNIYPSGLRDNQWFCIRIKVVRNRIQVSVEDYPTVDYLKPARASTPAGTAPPHGTIALQCHGPEGQIEFRRIAVRLLDDDANANIDPRASDDGYGVRADVIDELAGLFVPIIDCHVHLRGGMTVEKALDRQAVTGINVGVLRNLGQGWPLETDDELRSYIESVDDRPVFVGVQVNDRDWHRQHPVELLKKLDFILGDTMIMPMPTDSSAPVKLFQPDTYTIDDPEAWMQRYVQHNLRVLAEPITVLANPTWLPAPIADMYEKLWTDAQMRTIIRAAIDNNVALEINAGSGYPRDRFIRMAKELGVKFSFGSNNFDDRPHDMSRCANSVRKYGLTKDDMYVPGRSPFSAP